MRLSCFAVPILVAALHAPSACGQAGPSTDSDADGIRDTTEDALLQRFAPLLMIGSDDCAIQPAQFAPRMDVPTVLTDNGTLYGQVTPRMSTKDSAEIELHYYHLWRTDCGRMGHPLDAEHVAVMLRAHADRKSPDEIEPDDWKAEFWYAAAHEDTVCDGSQITRAKTIDATTHGATIWVSSGKHGSFLQEELCQRGCGGDRCVRSRPLAATHVINLGEWEHPMNGATWMASSRWPMKDKVTRSDFPAARLALLRKLPETDIAWANPAKRPVQAAILGGNSAIDGAATGAGATGGALQTTARSTDAAMTLASGKTGGALSTATGNAGDALGTATRNTGHALSSTFRGVRRALGGRR